MCLLAEFDCNEYGIRKSSSWQFHTLFTGREAGGGIIAPGFIVYLWASRAMLSHDKLHGPTWFLDFFQWLEKFVGDGKSIDS